MFGFNTSFALDNIQWIRENSEKDYCQCIQNIIQSRPFGNHKFYIFSFIKRVDDNCGIKKMYHQPRLTRPEPVPGTTLIKVDPKEPEIANIIWTLPQEENFNMYAYGKCFGDPFVYECVKTYIQDPKKFLHPDEDDLSDEGVRDIYRNMKRKKDQEA